MVHIEDYVVDALSILQHNWSYSVSTIRIWMPDVQFALLLNQIHMKLNFLFQTTGSVPPATNSRLSPLPPEPADFYNPTAPVDIPLDSATVCAFY